MKYQCSSEYAIIAIEKKTLVAKYYRVGLTFTEISQILSQLHGLTVSA